MKELDFSDSALTTMSGPARMRSRLSPMLPASPGAHSSDAGSWLVALPRGRAAQSPRRYACGQTEFPSAGLQGSRDAGGGAYRAPKVGFAPNPDVRKLPRAARRAARRPGGAVATGRGLLAGLCCRHHHTQSRCVNEACVEQIGVPEDKRPSGTKLTESFRWENLVGTTVHARLEIDRPWHLRVADALVIHDP